MSVSEARITRRSLLKGVAEAGLGALGLVTVGCGNEDARPTPPSGLTSNGETIIPNYDYRIFIPNGAKRGGDFFMFLTQRDYMPRVYIAARPITGTFDDFVKDITDQKKRRPYAKQGEDPYKDDKNNTATVNPEDIQDINKYVKNVNGKKLSVDIPEGFYGHEVKRVGKIVYLFKYKGNFWEIEYSADSSIDSATQTSEFDKIFPKFEEMLASFEPLK